MHRGQRKTGRGAKFFGQEKLRAIARELAGEPAVACSLSSPPAMNGGAPESAKAPRAGSRAEHAIGTMGCGTVAKAGTTVSGPGLPDTAAPTATMLSGPPDTAAPIGVVSFVLRYGNVIWAQTNECSADERSRPCASPRMRYDSTGGGAWASEARVRVSDSACAA